MFRSLFTKFCPSWIFLVLLIIEEGISTWILCNGGNAGELETSESCWWCRHWICQRLESAEKGHEFRTTSAMIEETEQSMQEDILCKVGNPPHHCFSKSWRYTAASSTRRFLRSGPCLAGSTVNVIQSRARSSYRNQLTRPSYDGGSFAFERLMVSSWEPQAVLTVAKNAP